MAGVSDDDEAMTSREMVDRVFEVVMRTCLVPGWLRPDPVEPLLSNVQLSRGAYPTAVLKSRWGLVGGGSLINSGAWCLVVGWVMAQLSADT